MLAIEELVENRSCILLNHLTKDSINADDISKLNIDKILGSASLTNKVRQVLLIYKDSLKVAKSNLLSLQDVTNIYYTLFDVVNVYGQTIRWGRGIKKQQLELVKTDNINNETAGQTKTATQKKTQNRNDKKNQVAKLIKEVQNEDDEYKF
jgi:hypothetical protein